MKITFGQIGSVSKDAVEVIMGMREDGVVVTRTHLGAVGDGAAAFMVLELAGEESAILRGLPALVHARANAEKERIAAFQERVAAAAGIKRSEVALGA